MGRKPKPFFWKARKEWFCTISGVRHRLGTEKEEAHQRFHEMMAKPQKRVVRSDAVAGIFDAFLEWVQKHKAERTFDWYQDFCQSFLDHAPKGITVGQLKPFHVQTWVDSHDTWGDSTKRGAIITVKRALHWACKQGYIDSSPISFMEKPAGGRREVVIPDDHYHKMLLVTKDQQFRDLLTVAWECGPRPQEILGVEARHVDLDRRCWIFDRVESKGKKLQRVVYLTDLAFDILKRLCEKNPEGKLFQNTRGVPFNPIAVSCRFRTLKKTVKKKYCLYNVRHTWINRLLKSGVDHVTVAVLAGHVDASMLAKVYQHLAQDPVYLRTALMSASASTGEDGEKSVPPLQPDNQKDKPECLPR